MISAKLLLGRGRRWLFLAAAWTAAGLMVLPWTQRPLLVCGALLLTFAATVVHGRHTRRAVEHSNALLESQLAELDLHVVSIAALGTMSDQLQTAVHLDDAYESIADSARQLFRQTTGALCTVDPERDLVEVVASWGEPATLPSFARQQCRILTGQRGRAPAGNDSSAQCDHIKSGPPTRTTCLPVTCAGETLVLVCIDSPEASEPDSFPAMLAIAFAEQVGLALTNIRLKETLRGQASHDPLTGLYNRRFLDANVHRELERAARNQSSVGVLMLDLDRFKLFNDAHGHPAGDALLREFATLLRSKIRAADIACRYGGDEFAVILPAATLADSRMRAEQLREATRAIAIELDGATLSGFTTSIGVAAYPEHGASPGTLMRAADAALYAAKANGRDRTEAAASFTEASRSSMP